MACKSIETKCGNVVEVDDEIGFPFVLRVEDDSGKAHNVMLSCDDARKIAKALEAFATIHER